MLQSNNSENYKYKSVNPRELQNFHLIPNLYHLFANPEVADVHFLFKDESKQIAAHRCLLAIASPVFQRMFYGELREEGDVNIVDASYDGFKEFLRFFYCKEFELSLENISEVMTLADKYDVKGLLNLCAIYLEQNIDIDSVCNIYDLALSFRLDHVIAICENKICCESNQVLSSENFRNCTKLVLTRILQMNRLSCDEMFIFKQTMDWATESCRRNGLELTIQNKKLLLGPCFDLIRFPTMSSEQFTTCISEDALLEPVEFLEILRYLTIKRDMNNCRFPTLPRCGIPTWTNDDIKFCDRRSLPNLKSLVSRQTDTTQFSVNERILLGQITLSQYHSPQSQSTEKEGTLTIYRLFENNREMLLNQKITIETESFVKVKLERPLVLQPFEFYSMETNFKLQNGEMIAFRTGCRKEIMLDGGIVFSFFPNSELDYDNVNEGIIFKFYFKLWNN